MKDSHLHSILKAISWRIVGTLSTICISFLLTHKISLSLYIGLSEFVAKIGLFYIHERMWGHFSFRLKPKTEYDHAT
ncbi:MAG: DUF2061 domain-containing protein [Gammaproteobacteria bacterium]|nr:DUF2061 domain-containing protein [Gammaproteobacteria bacterium]